MSGAEYGILNPRGAKYRSGMLAYSSMSKYFSYISFHKSIANFKSPGATLQAKNLGPNGSFALLAFVRLGLFKTVTIDTSAH